MCAGTFIMQNFRQHIRTFVVLGVIAAVVFAVDRVDAAGSAVKITVLFNNVPCRPDCETGWGFSCLIEDTAKTILFDTGDEGAVLLRNMQRMGVGPDCVDTVVLSHIHGDHVGGLGEFLRVHHDVVVYVPVSFPSPFKEAVHGCGATVSPVSISRELCPGVYTTGEMGAWIKEQALVVVTSHGLVVITGCAHPGIVNIVRKAQEEFGRDILLVMGGFHLSGKSPREINGIINNLKILGVRKVAPSHCTGERARTLFRQAWGRDFIEGGVGAVIELPP